MKRIMHLLNTGSFSGAENVAIAIIKAMQAKYGWAGIYASPAGSIEKVLKANDITHIPMKEMSIIELKRIIRKVKPDIIHAHDFTTSVTAALTMTAVPIISHLHNNPPWIKEINLKTIAYYLSTIRIKKILTVSDSVLDEFRFGEPLTGKSLTISNPIDIAAIQAKAMKSVSNDKTDIVFLGRLSVQKNPLRFIAIIDQIRKRLPDVKACMIGDGDLRNACEQRIQELGLSNHIILSGFMENPHTVLSQSKLLCMTSEWEGFGLVAVEALALGVPVAAVPVGGLIGIINSSCGCLYESDHEAVEEICSLLTDADYWNKKSKGALLRAEYLNNMESYLNKLDRLYTECLNK